MQLEVYASFECCRLLAAAKADVNAIDGDERTPLHLSARSGQGNMYDIRFDEITYFY